MKNTAKKRFWFALVVFSLIGQIAWVVENMYLNVFIYEMFGAQPAEISAMVMASAIAATLTTLLMGALSDRLRRRKIFMCMGYILWGLSILGFALVRIDVIGGMFPAVSSVSALCITLVILLDCLMTFFGSTANDAAFNAWLTDVTDESNRGAAEGINSMMPLVAILAVFGGFMAFDLGEGASWTSIFLIIGGVVLVIGVIGFFLIRDPELPAVEGEGYFRNIIYGFRPTVIRENPELYIYLAAFAVFGISIQIFMPYLILYYTVSLALENYVLIMAPAILLASVFTVFFGRAYDRFGVRRMLPRALELLMLGFVLLWFFKNVALVFIGSLLMMCGYLGGMAVFGAAIRDKTPEHRAGRFQGLRIFAQVLVPGIIGPAIGAAVLADAETVVNSDGTESFIPNTGIFVAALVVALILYALLPLIFRLFSRKEKTNEA